MSLIRIPIHPMLQNGTADTGKALSALVNDNAILSIVEQEIPSSTVRGMNKPACLIAMNTGTMFVCPLTFEMLCDRLGVDKLHNTN